MVAGGTVGYLVPGAWYVYTVLLRCSTLREYGSECCAAVVCVGLYRTLTYRTYGMAEQEGPATP